METTTVTIGDEPTRAVIWSALWLECSAELNGEQFANTAFEAGWQPINVEFGCPSTDDPERTLREALARLDQIREAGETIRSAGIGDTITIPFAAERLAHQLKDCGEYIEGGGFWQVEPGERAHVLACRDAALRLQAELAPAMVVA